MEKSNYLSDSNKQGKIKYDTFATDLIKKHFFKTLSDTEGIIYYENGYYQYGGEKKIKEEAQQLFHESINSYGIKEIIGHVKRFSYIDREEINKRPYLINMENGIYDLEKDKFVSHTPEEIITTRIPIIYDPNAKCPEIEKFVSEIVPNKEDVSAIYELVGYILYRGYPMHTFFIFLWNKGNNGKSKLISLLEKFAGERNVSHIALQQLNGV